MTEQEKLEEKRRRNRESQFRFKERKRLIAEGKPIPPELQKRVQRKDSAQKQEHGKPETEMERRPMRPLPKVQMDGLALRRLEQENGTLSAENSKLRKAKRDLEQMVAALRVAAEPKWIPVSDRLPERGSVVLCSIHGNLIPAAYFGVYEMKTVWRNGARVFFGEEVDAWMPMPETWREHLNA